MTAAATVVAAERRPALELVQRHAGAVGLALLVGLVSADNGGYFATAWGWATLALAWGAVMGLLLTRNVVLSTAELWLLAAAGAFTAWIGLSILWSDVRVESVNELERALVYLCALLAIVLVVRSASVSQLLGWLTVAIGLVCAYALATRLLPDRVGRFDSIGGYRLSDPVGYWNALGIVAAIGALLALGFAARGKRMASRAAAAGALPVLLLTLEFTFSRGSWLALAAGFAVMLAIDPKRLQLAACALVLAPAALAGVGLASRATALTTVGSSLVRATSQGHRLGLAVVILVLVSAAAACAFAFVEARGTPRPGTHRRFAWLLLTVVLAVGAGAVAARGGPAAVAKKAVHSFEQPPDNGARLSGRVFTFSSDGRLDLWRAAWHQFESSQAVGSGAGSYEAYWRLHRPNGLEVRDAHSLYLETAAELGIVGLFLLAAMLVAPFLALRQRHVALVPVAIGAYAAFLVHASVDWDWELPAVTLAGLTCGAAALVAAREESRRRELPGAVRYAGVAAVAAVAVFASVALVGNRALDSAQAAVNAKNWKRAEAEAHSAHTWLPWSSDPWRLLGDAEFGRGDFVAAARDYRRAIALDRRDWQLWYDLGFATSGRASDAAFAHARTLDPQNTDIPRSGKASHGR